MRSSVAETTLLQRIDGGVLHLTLNRQADLVASIARLEKPVVAAIDDGARAPAGAVRSHVMASVAVCP